GNGAHARHRQAAPLFIDADIAPIVPAESLEAFAESLVSGLRFWIIWKVVGEVYHSWQAGRLLRPCRMQPAGSRRTAEKRDAIAPPHGFPPWANDHTLPHRLPGSCVVHHGRNRLPM